MSKLDDARPAQPPHGGARTKGQTQGDIITLKRDAPAIATGQRIQAAAQQTTGEVLPADGSVNPGNARKISGHRQGAGGAAAGVSDRTQRKLDALALTFPCPGCGRSLPAVRRTDRDFTVCVCCKLDRIAQAHARRATTPPSTSAASPRGTPAASPARAGRGGGDDDERTQTENP